ncbi:acyltransferase family protein [Luteimonas sp. BDR2-5]|uniref:acyltransferase family protein n=1 Tax=Proluteimonas luteida TaxID=2878685 RepID=UPI001E2CD4D1|nr:acyltransferase family protein [Luteimonas sp. BDR2-5]MCD9029523.1 acyltransferase family protein [Luteimonas sp. BDR2-5]
MADARETWIDSVKGLTISLVALHHVFVGVRENIGVPAEVSHWYAASTSIRMPLFFLVAGFFAAKSVQLPLRKFIDSKVLHFFYFYLVWGIVYVVLRDGFASGVLGFIQNGFLKIILGSYLWFLYALSLSFIILRVTSRISPIIQIAIFSAFSAQIIIFHQDSQNIILKTLKIYPFFLIGTYASEWIRNFAVISNWPQALGLGLGMILSYLAVGFFGLNSSAVLFYILAFFAIGTSLSSVYLLRNSFIGRMFSYIGERSLYIYLIHFIPAAGFRVLAEKLGIRDAFSIVLLGTVVSIGLPIVIYNSLFKSRLKFLFVRPAVLRVGK